MMQKSKSKRIPWINPKSSRAIDQTSHIDGYIALGLPIEVETHLSLMCSDFDRDHIFQEFSEEISSGVYSISLDKLIEIRAKLHLGSTAIPPELYKYAVDGLLAMLGAGTVVYAIKRGYRIHFRKDKHGLFIFFEPGSDTKPDKNALDQGTTFDLPEESKHIESQK